MTEKNTGSTVEGAGIAAIYCAARSQIVTDKEGNRSYADTVIYIFTNGVFRQYIMQKGRITLYSEGICELDGELDLSGPVVVTMHVKKIRVSDKEYTDIDAFYDVSLTDRKDYCLYPVNAGEDADVAAAFMHAEAQPFVQEDGTRITLPTMWFYFADGTFRQFALINEKEDVLFSTGSYTIDGDFRDDSATVHIARDHKYFAIKGLDEYESAHDFTIGEITGAMGFTRIFPEG